MQDHVVSYVDVYRTLAEIINVTPKCYEGPDSRSLLPILEGEGELMGNKAILTHAVYDGKVAIRRGRWKWIPEIKALYDMEWDISERENKFEHDWGKRLAARMDDDLNRWLDEIEEREKRTDYGALKIC